MIRPVRSRSRRVAPVIFIAFLVLVGIFLFWMGLRAFRAQARERAAEREAMVTDEGESEVLSALPSIAPLRAAGEQIGRATRVFTKEGATLEMTASLPPLDETIFAYHVWLVKDGLADVVDLGSLRLSEMGVWSGTFYIHPETGIINPELYSRVVIMIESRDGDERPSGQDVAEGFWEPL